MQIRSTLTLITRQPNESQDVDTHKNTPFLPVQLTVVVQHKDGDPGCMDI